MARRLPVSDAELEVLKVLWAAGPATVRDVAAALRKHRRRLAYNTVLTLLSRLRDKGYVAADRRDTAHLFPRGRHARGTARLDPVRACRPGLRRHGEPARAGARPRSALLGRTKSRTSASCSTI